jgi:hypothetical protein
MLMRDHVITELGRCTLTWLGAPHATLTLTIYPDQIIPAKHILSCRLKCAFGLSLPLFLFWQLQHSQSRFLVCILVSYLPSSDDSVPSVSI